MGVRGSKVEKKCAQEQCCGVGKEKCVKHQVAAVVRTRVLEFMGECGVVRDLRLLAQ